MRSHEAEFLNRLMVRLGAEETRARVAIANASPEQVRAKMIKNSEGVYLNVAEEFDRAWRRVGLALDRIGFTVEDRDRTQGLYFVRYVDQAQDAQAKGQDKGLFGGLFSFGAKEDKKKTAQRYRISIKGTGAESQVSVLNNDGRVETSQTAEKILSLLTDQLK